MGGQGAAGPGDAPLHHRPIQCLPYHPLHARRILLQATHHTPTSFQPHTTPLPEPHVCTQHFAATFCTRIVCTSMMMVPHAGPLPRRPAHTLLLRPPRRHLRHSHRPLERPRRLGSGPGQASNRTGARECPELAGALDDAGFDAGEVWRGVCEMAGAAVLANRERHKIARIIGPSYETNEAAPCTARPLGRLL